VISASMLSRSFDGVPAVESVSFEIPEGSLFTLLGPKAGGQNYHRAVVTRLDCTKSAFLALPPDMRRGSASPFGSVCEWAMPLVRALPTGFKGPKAEPGAKQARWLPSSTGEAEPRLTSGGKADTTEFLCKAMTTH
jgi:hypothetical protein